MARKTRVRESVLFTFFLQLESLLEIGKIHMQAIYPQATGDMYIEFGESSSHRTTASVAYKTSSGATFTVKPSSDQRRDLCERVAEQYSDILPRTTIQNFQNEYYYYTFLMPLDDLKKQLSFFFTPLPEQPAETYNRKVWLCKGELSLLCKGFMEQYVINQREDLKEFDININQFKVEVGTASKKFSIAHSSGRTAMSALQSHLDATMRSTMKDFQNQFADQMLSSMEMTINGVKVSGEEIKGLIKASSRYFGRIDLSSQIIALAELLRNSTDKADRKVHTLLTSNDPEERQLGKALAKILERQPDNAKTFQAAVE